MWYERQLLYLIIKRGNCFSIIEYILLRQRENKYGKVERDRRDEK